MSQRVFITGGASGLGKAIASHYAQRGWKVAIGDISEQSLQQAQTELTAYGSEVLALRCNVSQLNDLEQVREQLLAQWGGLDVLVNNAGIVGAIGPVERLTEDDWSKVVDVNLLGVVRGCQVFTSLFKEQGSGAIVNIASNAGIHTPPNMSIYNTTKAAVIALTETLRYELAPHNVHAHVVCPAFFKTNLTDSMESGNRSKAFVDRAMSKSPLSADDIAALIAQQVDGNRLYLMPHKFERSLWRLKRFLPGWYERKMHQAFDRFGALD